MLFAVGSHTIVITVDSNDSALIRITRNLMQEIELKFLIPEARLKGVMRQTRIKSSKEIPMAAHYYDTPDQQLANAGIGLRIRKEGDSWVQTIKAGGDGIAARLEHNASLDNEQVQAMLDTDTLMPDLTLYKDTSIEPALADFKLKKLAKNLTRQYVTDVQRTTRLVVDANSKSNDNSSTNKIEVAYDYGQIIHGNDETQCQPIQEIEFELVSGELEFLFATAKTWCKRYKLCLSTITKAERGGLLVKGEEYSPAVNTNLSQLSVNKDDSMPTFVRAVVHNCLLQILPNSSAIAAGSQDYRHALQLRIGISRLRFVLSTFENFSDQINPEWLPVLKQTAILLSDYYSIAFMANVIEVELQRQGAPHIEWHAELKAAKVTPINAICANDFQLTLLELIEFTMSNPDDEPQKEKLAIDKVVKILSTQCGRLFKSIQQLNDLNSIEDHNSSKISVLSMSKNNDVNSELHDELTKQAQYKLYHQLKNLRYVSEFTAPLYSKKKSKRWLKRLLKAQKSLGQYLDTIKYQQRYEQKSLTDYNALYGAGWFAATLKNNRKDYQKQLARIQDCEVFW